MVICGDWRCTLNPYSSHINGIYIKGVWQPLYTVDVHMDVSPPLYGCSCRPSFWNFARNMGYSQAISHGEMQWLRLYTQPIFISHQCYIYKVFDKLYMLWMCIWMCTYHRRRSPTIVDSFLRSFSLKSQILTLKLKHMGLWQWMQLLRPKKWNAIEGHEPNR